MCLMMLTPCGVVCRCALQAFINTAREIYKKIQDGVFDVSNEVSALLIRALPVATRLVCAWLRIMQELCCQCNNSTGTATYTFIQQWMCAHMTASTGHQSCTAAANVCCSPTVSRSAMVQAAPAHKT